MNKIFKTIKGEKVNVVEHTLEILRKNPNIKIHIGTDSQNSGVYTTYSVVIAYRMGTRGVHYITAIQRYTKIIDMWSRLWKEAELSIETAEWLTQQINVRVELDMDYNSDERYKSNNVVAAATGWANSLGYKVNTKPETLIATKAADHNCR